MRHTHRKQRVALDAVLAELTSPCDFITAELGEERSLISQFLELLTCGT